jgi:uncharacterized membrane protein
VTFESSKTLGGIGALLLFIGFIPPVSGYSFGILPLVGLILLLIGLKGLAGYYKEAGIFNNALYACIAGVVGVAVVAAILVTAVVGLVDVFVPGWNGDWTSLAQMNAADIGVNVDFSAVAPFLASVLIALIVLFIVVLVVALLFRKSLGLLRAKSGVGLFGSAGTVLIVGAVLTIIGVGLILVWIALLLVAIALFQLKEPTQTIPPPQYPPQYVQPQV